VIAPQPRELVLDRLTKDLVGPVTVDEVLGERPSDRYLLGILYPPGEEIEASEDDANREEPDRPGLEGPSETNDIPLYRSLRPSSLGLSFRLRSEAPRVRLAVSGGTYEAVEDVEGDDSPSRRRWQRHAVDIELELSLEPGYRTRAICEKPALTVVSRVAAAGPELWAATVVVVNESDTRAAALMDEVALFQSRLRLSVLPGSTFEPRPLGGSAVEEEDRSSQLLYRKVREYAVGHAASASWEEAADGVAWIETTWLPQVPVVSFSAEGARQFGAWAQGDGPSATWLSSAERHEVLASLESLVDAYREWIREQRARVSTLQPEHSALAADHLDTCEAAAERIEAGVRLLRDDEAALRAFRLANQAMVMQRSSVGNGRPDLRWRPFQLAFQLLSLPSLADPQHSERDVMDLLWFPTGGGKTEAYLGLIAFLAFYRRLTRANPDDGAGVAAIMRYTLRVLTAQQFQRAAAMIAACEELRAASTDLGATRFSIGLWIGGDATPNTVKAAAERPAELKVLPGCPRCGDMLTNPTASERRQWCRNESCAFSKTPVPLYVVDDDVYAARPTLLIATVDKFAQITRKSESQALFSLDRLYPPPDLVLQDELHLVSGPLGTIAGLYEIAIDEFCAAGGHRPKVIGSTATIRRASSQVRALFNRDVRSFPPPGIDHDDSGFAVPDPTVPGRVYVGVPTAGRSPKYALQALMATVLQSAAGIRHLRGDDDVDPFWTLVAYFNSIRELGGAVVLVEDDVRRSIQAIASRRGEDERDVGVPAEVTSRIPTTEIPGLLQQLETTLPESEIDVVLASNMISVGVDVPRLGLMVVNGQPKTTAEYIQATSRVGRQATPGLVLVLYNVNRPRDRSRYESFATWHRALYRDVEPTSVTPFAPRARDRALHGPLVSMLRLGHPTASDAPALRDWSTTDVEAVLDALEARVRDVDPAEAEATLAQARRLLDDWRAKGDVDRWWWSRYQKKSDSALMISAEEHAAMRATGRVSQAWPTPNSMRDVEPTSRFRLAPYLARPKEPSDGA
jgi:hypothetical protein